MGHYYSEMPDIITCKKCKKEKQEFMASGLCVDCYLKKEKK